MSKKSLWSMLALLAMLSMLLGACQPAPAAPVAEAPVVEEPAAEAPAVEPTVEPEPEPVLDLDTPAGSFLGAMQSYNTITPQAVNEALVDGQELFLIDVREVSELEEKGHIEGAINIPLRTLGENIDKLPAQDAAIVAYCGSGWRSTLAMAGLGMLGYTNVKTMVGGSFGGWVEAGFPVVEGVPAEAPVLDAFTPDPLVLEAVNAGFAGLPEGWGGIDPAALNEALIEGQEFVLIDVRKPAELEEYGAIEGAINIPLEELIARKAEWPAQDANVIIYCKAGTRGNIAAQIMRAYGYTSIQNVKGGMDAWLNAGLPVVGGFNLDEAAASFLGAMQSYNTITPQAVNEAIVAGEELFLIDVREVSELEEKGYIEGAINIPLRMLGQNINKLPAQDAAIVVYCGSGWRSTLAMTGLGLLGYTNVKTMVGGSFGGWVEAGFPVVEGVPPAAEALNAYKPNGRALALVDTAFTNLPEGWGVLEAAALNEALIEGQELVLIDVRKAEEVAENGTIEGAINIPLEELVARKAEWPAQDAQIVIFCKAGTRGNIAAMIMRTYGYTSIQNVKGGFDAWTAAGLPVFKS